LKRFEHGGDVFNVCKEKGIPFKEVIDFSASINPLGISKNAELALKRSLKKLVHYPEPFSRTLSGEIARYLGVNPSSIIPANGSTELIYLIPRAIRPRSVLIHEPTFSEYERAARLSGAKIKNINGLSFKGEDFLKAIKGKDMAFLCSPNNPTGELIERGVLLEIARTAKRSKCFLLLDEAFIDFVPHGTLLGEISRNPYLIILRSLTKFYALTGLRVGYAVCAPETAKKILRFKEPWAVNILAKEAVIASIKDKAHAEKTHSLIKKEKAFIERELENAGVWFFPSSANFYLIRIKRAGELRKELLRKGIILRDCSNFKGLSTEYLRFAVRSRKENMTLLREITTVRLK
jgi:threonine-phosphate decarboxylase